MNTYLAQETFIVRTESGQRIRLEAGKCYDGGFDFDHPEMNRAFLLVMVDGRKERVLFTAGKELIEDFQFQGRVDKPHYERVEVVKRPRISKC